MHFFWFLWEHIHLVLFFILPYSLAQCKPKKKFNGDSRVELVNQNTPKNQSTKAAGHRPQSEVAPTETPVDTTKASDTLANVASIAPDVSTGAPPKN